MRVRLVSVLFFLLAEVVSAHPLKIIIARHGETDFNLKKIAQGHTDSQLTVTGKSQANILQKSIRAYTIARCISSDLSRAKNTAGIALGQRKLKCEQDPRLRERSLGPFEGKPYQELISNKVKVMSHPGVESNEKIQIRLNSFLDDLSRSSETSGARNESHILVVTHSGVVKNIIEMATKSNSMHMYKESQIDIENCGWIIVSLDRKKLTLLETHGVTFKR